MRAPASMHCKFLATWSHVRELLLMQNCSCPCLLQRMLATEPSQRPSADALLKHPLVNKPALSLLPTQGSGSMAALALTAAPAGGSGATPR